MASELPLVAMITKYMCGKRHEGDREISLYCFCRDMDILVHF